MEEGLNRQPFGQWATVSQCSIIYRHIGFFGDSCGAATPQKSTTVSRAAESPDLRHFMQIRAQFSPSAGQVCSHTLGKKGLWLQVGPGAGAWGGHLANWGHCPNGLLSNVGLLAGGLGS